MNREVGRGLEVGPARYNSVGCAGEVATMDRIVVHLSTTIAVVLMAAIASATVVLPVSMQQMAMESDVVIHARVSGQQVSWDERHVRVLTLTSVDVIAGIKGAQKGDRLTIYQVAGTLDGVTFDIPGALHFVRGEEMVLFAKRYQDKIVSYGMGLGKYRVVEQGGQKFVAPEYGDVAFVEPSADRRVLPAERPATATQPLTRFIARVRCAVASSAGERGAP
jgi:hypothetical protein